MSSARQHAVVPAALLGGTLILAGCAVSGGQQGPTATVTVTAPPSSAPPSSAPPSSAPGAPTAGLTASAAPIDQSNWKMFSHAGAGLAFDYPATWSVRTITDEVSHGIHFVVLNLLDARGNHIATVDAHVATDTDGDLGSYRRTVVDQAPVPALADIGYNAAAYLELEEGTFPDDPPKSAARMFIADEIGHRPGESTPSLRTFQLVPDEQWGWFYTEQGFWNGTVVDADKPTLEQLQKFAVTERFQAMKQIMLSVRRP